MTWGANGVKKKVLSAVAIDGPAFDEANHFILAANTFPVADTTTPQPFEVNMNTTWQVIPEPGTFAMMGLGVAAIRFARWRRRRKAA